MNYQINSIEKCKEVLEKLKQEGYILFGFGGIEPEGFEIKYINSKKTLRFSTLNKEVENYFLKHGVWKKNLQIVKIIKPTDRLKIGQECKLVYDYDNGKYLICDGISNHVINKSDVELVEGNNGRS